MRIFNNIGWLVLLSLIIQCRNHPQNIEVKNEKGYLYGKVVGIFDGDTYNLLTSDNQTVKVRMEGIDAPEREMPFHSVSRQYLSKLIFKKEIKLKRTGEDQFGRTLGFTYVNDSVDVNLEMLKAGMVWHYKRYNSDKKYAEAEKTARALKLGLWKDGNPVAPWNYRKEKRNVLVY